MRLGNIVAAVLLGKLAAAVIKKSRENSPDIRETFSGKNGNGSASSRTSSNRAADCQQESSPENIDKRQYPPAYSVYRPIPDSPDKGIPDNFTPYEGEDMTFSQAREAGFEFEGYDRYHGVDDIIDGGGFAHRDTFGNVFRSRYMGNRSGVPGCAVTGWHGTAEIVKIPRSINGRPVLKIDEKAFGRNARIREVYLPDTVLEIGGFAFSQCGSLKYARLSKQLVRIGEYAFWMCNSLERVYLGGVRYIGNNAFSLCEGLRFLRLPERVEYLGDDAFARSGLEKLYWNKITCAGDHVLLDTPYQQLHNIILLGDCLQKCSVRGYDEIIIDDPHIHIIGSSCFFDTAARRVTLSDSVREIKCRAFMGKYGGASAIDEIYAPRVWRLGDRCFSPNQKITVSSRDEYVEVWESGAHSAEGYLYINENSLYGTDMERKYPGGSIECPLVCVMVRHILVRVEEVYQQKDMDHWRKIFADTSSFPRQILTFADGGDTLVMDEKTIGYSVVRYMRTYGAKKLVAAGMLFSWDSVQYFTELEFHRLSIAVREKSRYRPPKSVTLRFKFTDYTGRKTDSAVLLYLPNFVNGSQEADRLYELYESCLKKTFDFDLYDSSILSLISSWRGKFTAARMRLEGGLCLSDEARERYLQLFKKHRRKASFIARKHNDTALLNLLDNLSAYEKPNIK